MAKVFTSGTVLGDVLISEGAQEFTRESVTITNPEAAENTFAVGYPVTLAGVPLLTAALNTMQGILLHTLKMDASATHKEAVLARGPAVVNKSALPTSDYNGGAFDMDVFAAMLASLGVVVRTEAPLSTTQTT